MAILTLAAALTAASWLFPVAAVPPPPRGFPAAADPPEVLLPRVGKRPEVVDAAVPAVASGYSPYPTCRSRGLVGRPPAPASAVAHRQGQVALHPEPRRPRCVPPGGAGSSGSSQGVPRRVGRRLLCPQEDDARFNLWKCTTLDVKWALCRAAVLHAWIVTARTGEDLAAGRRKPKVDQIKCFRCLLPRRSCDIFVPRPATTEEPAISFVYSDALVAH